MRGPLLSSSISRIMKSAGKALELLPRGFGLVLFGRDLKGRPDCLLACLSNFVSRNSNCETGSQSNNTVSSPHGFIINEIEVFEGNEEVTKVIDVENWWIDNSRVLRWVVSLIEWNSSVLSTKSSIQNSQPLSPRIKNNRDAHVDYLKVTQEHTNTLRDIVEQARALKPLGNALDYAQALYTARDEKLVPSEERVKIGKNNLRIDPTLTQKEETYQLILDIIKNTPCYNAFLIIADVPEIYMHQFRFTIKKKITVVYMKKLTKKKESSDEESDEQEERLIRRKPKAQLEIDIQKAIKANKHESRFQHQSCGSSEGAGITPKVLDEPTGKSIVLDEGVGTSLEVSDETKYKSKALDDLDDWGSTSDETFLFDDNDEKAEDILWVFTDKDEFDDDDEEEDDKSIDIEKKNAEAEINSLLDIQIQQEIPNIQQESFHAVKVSIILEPIQIPPSTPPAPPLPATVIPFSPAPNSKAFNDVFQRVSELEKDVKELKQVDHSTTILESIKSEVSEAVNEYLGSTIGDALQKALQRHTKELKHEFTQKTGHQTYTEEIHQQFPRDDVSKFIKVKQELAAKKKMPKYSTTPYDQAAHENTNRRTSYLLWIMILRGKDNMMTKIKTLLLDQTKGRKREEIENTLNHKLVYESEYVMIDVKELNLDNVAYDADEPQADAIIKISKDWFKKYPRPETLDPNWNTVKTIDDAPEQKFRKTVLLFYYQDTSCKVEKKSGYGYLKDIVVRWDDKNLNKFKEGEFSDLHLNDIEDMLLLIAQNKLFDLEGVVIVDFSTTLKMFTQRIIVQNRVEDVQFGVESYQRKLNLTKTQRTCPHISVKEPYTPNFNPSRFIYKDKSKKKRLTRVDEIHKFCDGTLQSDRNILHQRLQNFRLGYNKDMP
uniref:Uncharacterized protein n=1 Tax=Tanacetum cinerariifolium TaxID=118510 RepID=A0A6L2KFY0_TANCI|nr:hypothetical protein [Tanacetum cinerariifolium]